MPGPDAGGKLVGRVTPRTSLPILLLIAAFAAGCGNDDDRNGDAGRPVNPVLLGRELRVEVRAEPEEGDVTEIKQAGIADDDIEPEAEKHALEWLVLEGRAAEVADEGRIRGPRSSGDAVERGEGRQRMVNGSRGERYRCAAAWDVPGHNDHRASPLREDPAGRPVDSGRSSSRP